MKNILPPGASTYLPKDEVQLINSYVRFAYENIMLDTAVSQYLSDLGADKGLTRPVAFFSSDDLWRAVLKQVLFGKKHTRDSVRKVFELILGPLKTQVTVLDRKFEIGVTVGKALNITSGASTGAYTVVEVRTHELVVAANSFSTVPESNVSYNVEGIYGVNGSLSKDSDGYHVLQDTTKSFINTHSSDFLTKLNIDVPQYGKLTFNKNSPTDQEKLVYGYYDNLQTGILKLHDDTKKSRDKYMPIRSSSLSANVSAKALSLSIKDNTNFPTNSAASTKVVAGTDELEIFVSGGSNTMHTIASVSGNTITVSGATPLTVPANSPGTKTTYSVGKPAVSGTAPVLDLQNTGTIYSQKGQILNTTTLVDKTNVFDSEVNTTRFCITINRGEPNEETIEVTQMSGTTLYLVKSPDDTTGSTSLLQYDHEMGESVEVAFTSTATTASYFPLYANGNVEGTDTSTNGVTNKIADSASTTFSAALVGSEIEITGPTTSKNYGYISKITSVDVSNKLLTISPSMPEVTKGNKYKIRKFYTSADDTYLYVADSSGLPKSNFSLILDRGNPNEEVVWITDNTILNSTTNLGKLTIGNNDNSAANVSKNHKYGISAEAAQVLFESCDWEIIETRATGEYSVVVSENCVFETPEAFYLHEKIDTSKYINDANDLLSGSEDAALHSNASTSDTTINIDIDHLDESLAGSNGRNIFRAARITNTSTDPDTAEDIFLIREETYTVLSENYPSSQFVSGIDDKVLIVEDASLFAEGDQLVVGSGSNTSIVTVDKVDSAKNHITLNSAIDVSDVTNYGYLEKTPVRKKIAKIKLNSALKSNYPSATSTVSLLWMYNQHVHDSMLSTNSVFAGGGTTSYIISTAKSHSASVGDFVEIVSSQFTPALIGQKRKITKIGGSFNRYLYVDPPFTSAINVTDKYKIHSDLQLGDTNLQYYSGELSVYPGAYLYTKFFSEVLTDGEVVRSGPFNQPSHLVSSLASGVDPSNLQAVYQIPGTAYMIAPPVLDIATAIQDPASNLTDIIVSGGELASTLTTAVGNFLEILDPEHPNYKQKFLIKQLSDIGVGNTKVTLSHSMKVKIPYKGSNGSIRILSDTNETLAVDVNGSSFYVDDASLFPDSSQNPIYVTLADELANEDLIEIVSVDKNRNLLTIATGSESLQSSYSVGTTVHLNVKYLALKSTGDGWPTVNGAIYMEYGFSGNHTVSDSIYITGTATGGKVNELEDKSKDFMGYGNPYDLIGATVHIITSAGNNLDGKSKTVIDVLSNTLVLDSDLSTSISSGDTYKVVNKYVELDNDDEGGNIDQVGGILKAIKSSAVGQTSHPERVGGIRHEYVKYKTRVGNVLELEDYKVFKYPRPPESQVILASGYYESNKFGKDHRPYLNGNVLDVILNENLSPFGGIISAAGIKAKTEVSEVGKKDA